MKLRHFYNEIDSTRWRGGGAKTTKPAGRCGRLTVVQLVMRNHRAHWLCRCDCGEERVVRRAPLVNGTITECGTCAHRRAAVKGGNTNRLSAEEALLRDALGHYRQNAKRRGLSFELPGDETRAMFERACHYCGEVPTLLGGIDRVNNGGGYTLANSVPCCATCNYAKREQSAADFIAWALRVAVHSGTRT